jgi:hypothetical protein
MTERETPALPAINARYAGGRRRIAKRQKFQGSEMPLTTDTNMAANTWLI